MDNYFIYEVSIYRIFKERSECISSKFFRSVKKYTGNSCISKKLNKECTIVKFITEFNENNSTASARSSTPRRRKNSK